MTTEHTRKPYYVSHQDRDHVFATLDLSEGPNPTIAFIDRTECECTCGAKERLEFRALSRLAYKLLDVASKIQADCTERLAKIQGSKP